MTPTKVAIVGTAGSYRNTPWDDPSIAIYGLNDAYMVKGGLPRVGCVVRLPSAESLPARAAERPDGVQPVVFAHDVPFGHYVRPTQHLDWLAAQPFRCGCIRTTRRSSRRRRRGPRRGRFPRPTSKRTSAATSAPRPRGFSRTPCSKGIATSRSTGFISRPNRNTSTSGRTSNFSAGVSSGPTKRTVTVADGKRIYESQDGRLVLPVASPVLDAKFPVCVPTVAPTEGRSDSVADAQGASEETAAHRGADESPARVAVGDV
jgi:hypothetical protein